MLIARFYKGVADKAMLNPTELSVFAVADGRLTDLIQKNERSGEMSVNAEDVVDAMRYMYTEYREMKGM